MSATRSLFERRDVIIVASVFVHLRSGLAGSLLRHAGHARKRSAHFAGGAAAPRSSIFSTIAPKTCVAALFAFAVT